MSRFLGLAVYPTWIVVREHVPVEIKKSGEDYAATPDAGLESDVEKKAAADAIIISPEEKETFATAKTNGGKDAV